jgi:hypothetical protein
MPKACLRGMIGAPSPMVNNLDKIVHFRGSRGVYHALTLIGKDRRKSVNKRRNQADAL